MSRESLYYRDTYGLRSYEVDKAHRVRPSTICRFFQETAWHHAEKLGYGFRAMAEQGIFWIMARMLILMEEYPQWEDEVTVETWPSARDRLCCYRDFRLFGEKGRKVGSGTTTWIALDAKTRRPWPTRKYMSLIPVDSDRSVDRNASKLPALSCPEMTGAKPVRYSDIDVNGHVNNVAYFDRIMDSFSDDFLEKHILRDLEINFLNEALGGDEMVAYREPTSPSQYLHAVQRKSDETDLCRAATSWEEIGVASDA